MRLGRPGITALLIVACVATGISSARAADPCKATSISVDTSLANTSGGTLHDSVGQTFLTPDTLMTSLTVWGVPGSNYYPVSAVLVGTDSTGVPTPPRLWEGPALTPSGSTAFTWTMDPPLALPHAGRYAWFVCSGEVNLRVVAGPDAYPDGQIWSTCGGECGPGCARPANADFVFTVTFCSDRATATRRHTWGELKTIYR